MQESCFRKWRPPPGVQPAAHQSRSPPPPLWRNYIDGSSSPLVFFGRPFLPASPLELTDFSPANFSEEEWGGGSVPPHVQPPPVFSPPVRTSLSGNRDLYCALFFFQEWKAGLVHFLSDRFIGHSGICYIAPNGFRMSSFPSQLHFRPPPRPNGMGHPGSLAHSIVTPPIRFTRNNGSPPTPLNSGGGEIPILLCTPPGGDRPIF